MPQKLSPADLRLHFVEAIARSNHHALEVRDIVPLLIGNIFIYSDKDAQGNEEITVISTSDPMDKTGNSVWCIIGGKRYYFGYTHSPQEIVIREGTNRGNDLFSCNNSTPIKSINDFFDSLNPTVIPIL